MPKVDDFLRAQISIAWYPFMKKTLPILFAQLLLAMSSALATGSSLREDLAIRPEIDWIIPLDERTTVASKAPSGFFGVTEQQFQESVASVCPSGWMIIRTMKNPDPMRETYVQVPMLLYGKKDTATIFQIGASSGIRCKDGFNLSARVNPGTESLVAKRPIIFDSDKPQKPLWKGKPKEFYDDETVPANGLLTGKMLGFDRLMINGIESYAWAHAKCTRRGGRISLYIDGAIYPITDNESILKKMLDDYPSPYTYGRGVVYSHHTTPYYLGCDGNKPFVLKVKASSGTFNEFDQEILFEDGRTLKSVL